MAPSRATQQALNLAAIEARKKARLGAQFVAEAVGSVAGSSLDMATNMSSVSMKEVFKGVVEQAALGVGEQVRVMNDSLLQNTGGNRSSRITAIHQIAGQRAIEAAANAAPRSDTNQTPRRGRYANGFLRRALLNPANIEATSTGVGVFKPRILDGAAAHWYRLNFGAGAAGRASSSSRLFPLSFLGSNIGSIGIVGPPSPDFSIPSGYFVNGQFFLGRELGGRSNAGGSRDPLSPNQVDPLSPARREATRLARRSNQARFVRAQVTRGIKATNYLNAGAAALAESLSDGWSVLFSEWLDEATRGEPSPTARVVTPAEARSLIGIISSQAKARVNASLIQFRSKYSSL